MQTVSEELPKLADIKRQLKNTEHDLESIASTRPDNGAEVTLAFRRVQEAIMYVEKAEAKS